MIILHTNYGDIHVEFDYGQTPKTAKHFEEYVTSGFDDGVIFRGVINSFMVQGGSNETCSHIANEADNGLTNDTGTLAMARTMDLYSASSQFLINVADNAFLNHRSNTSDGWGYAMFDKVTAGRDIIYTIKEVKIK